ncbi:HD domain-containing protein [Prevotella koreensis]|uniref:CCA tRNA nucleotidyltransferase n=1 Tax=Prevotella koreensis TaxID=2490854 RepID=UPI0028E21B39|nr:HD domain-containing protein [Prevotella koreensis]
MRLYSDAELAQILDKDIFRKISDAADSLGVECYVVGGFVRDIFLGRPSNDIDVVVVGSGIAVATELKKRLGRRAHLSVFRNFGTAQVKFFLLSDERVALSDESVTLSDERVALSVERVALSDEGVAMSEKQEKTSSLNAQRSARLQQETLSKRSGERTLIAQPIEVEFVGARKESYSHDSRKPIVENGTLEDDQNRRDFTINALAICLNKERFGELVDPFDGIYDMEDRIIRTPLDPDITFSDDPLRMLRCVRFSAQLKFDIEEETFDALQRNAHRLKIISGERIQEELNKIIMTEKPSRGIYDLYRAGLLQYILPELCALDVVETRNGKSHKNNFYHTLEVLDNVAASDDNSLWLRWSAILHDVGKPKSKRWDNAVGWSFHNHNYIGARMVPQIFRRIKLPLDAKMKFVQKMVDLHMRPIVIADEEVTDSAVRRLINDADADIDSLMTLCEADITSKNEVRKARFRDNFRLVREKLAKLKEDDYKRKLQPVIDGNEIMQMFGLKPSREVGELKKCLKEAVLDNSVANEREPLMQLLMEKAKSMGLNIVNSI